MRQLAIHVDKDYASNPIRVGALARLQSNKQAQPASLASLASDLASAGHYREGCTCQIRRRGAAGILLNNPTLAVTAYADRPP
jgi:hypothetical protein